MKTLLIISIPIFLLFTCDSKKETEENKTFIQTSSGREGIKKMTKSYCDYLQYYNCLGNTEMDTFRKEGQLIDPIDDTLDFKRTKFGFLRNGDKVYKKSITTRFCDIERVRVEFFQNLSDKIDLKSYREIGERFFVTQNKVFFWWINSDGHLIIPVFEADAKTFVPFKKICGGTDKKNIYYGCPNRGVYKLKFTSSSKFEFIPKEDNYWNSPNHYLIVNKKVYDKRFSIEKGYYFEENKDITIDQVKKNKKDS
jgi:hypothetical protein